MTRQRELHPTLRMSNLTDVVAPYRRLEDLARYAEGLRQIPTGGYPPLTSGGYSHEGPRQATVALARAPIRL